MNCVFSKAKSKAEGERKCKRGYELKDKEKICYVVLDTSSEKERIKECIECVHK